MSHQTTFYITPKDTDELEERFQKLGPLTILHDYSASAKPRTLDRLSFAEDGKPWWSMYLIRPDDLGQVVTQFVPKQDHWVVDELRSPVIEFMRSYFDGEILRRGRIYYRDGFWGEDDAWVTKSETFRGWAKNVNTAVKRYLKRHGRDYIGPDALAWLESSGGRLVE